MIKEYFYQIACKKCDCKVFEIATVKAEKGLPKGTHKLIKENSNSKLQMPHRKTSGQIKCVSCGSLIYIEIRKMEKP